MRWSQTPFRFEEFRLYDSKKPRSLNHAAGTASAVDAAKSSRGFYRQVPNTVEVVDTSSGLGTSQSSVHLAKTSGGGHEAACALQRCIAVTS